MCHRFDSRNASKPKSPCDAMERNSCPTNPMLNAAMPSSSAPVSTTSPLANPEPSQTFSVPGISPAVRAIAVSAAPALCTFFFFKTFSMKASPALYELRTSGPLAQYRNPRSSARCRHVSNAAGVTYSCTFMWRLVGCMYCPNVTTSTSALRNSVRRAD